MTLGLSMAFPGDAAQGKFFDKENEGNRPFNMVVPGSDLLVLSASLGGG